jgi:hypothetical protein
MYYQTKKEVNQMDFINFMDQELNAKSEKNTMENNTMKDNMMKDEMMKDKMKDSMMDENMIDNKMLRNETIDKIRPLAMAYIPMQKWGPIYDPEKGLKQGTIFPDLDFPFLGREMSSK